MSVWVMTAMSRVDLPVITASEQSGVRPASIDRCERDRLIRQAKGLSWLSLGWMSVEAGIAIAAALAAGSVALLGFGLDSVIEALASIVVIWRFTSHRRLSDRSERRAQQLVAVSFFLLAPYLAQDAVRALVSRDHPSISWVGIGLSISSLIVMPLLGRAKQRIGSQLGSAATAGEGTQNLLCAYLALGVLVGLALNAAFGAWWADPFIALAIAALAVREGLETWRGDGCCTPSPTAAGPAYCDEECCGG
jgi:divalent metal cation (Fe/Co/Zn/Cd) transporter